MIRIKAYKHYIIPVITGIAVLCAPSHKDKIAKEKLRDELNDLK